MLYSIHLTNKCNLRCFYCYEDERNEVEFTISIKELDDRMKWITERGDCTDIELLGGEVFLFPDILQYIFDNYGKDYKYIITTNGTIRNDQIDAMIQQYQPGIGVSLDYPGNVEEFRVGLNLQKALDNAHAWRKWTTVGICCVIHPYNADKVKETFDFYVKEHGFKTIHFGIVEEWYQSERQWAQYMDEVKRLIDSVDIETLSKVTISPWTRLSKGKKEIINEDGVEKVEIFTDQPAERSPYYRAKEWCHEYLQAKLKGGTVAKDRIATG